MRIRVLFVCHLDMQKEVVFIIMQKRMRYLQVIHYLKVAVEELIFLQEISSL